MSAEQAEAPRPSFRALATILASTHALRVDDAGAPLAEDVAHIRDTFAEALGGPPRSPTLPPEPCGTRTDDGPCRGEVVTAWDAAGRTYTVCTREDDHTAETWSFPTMARTRDQLPTFEDVRTEAHRLLGDVADVLRSDWRDTEITRAQADGRRAAITAVGEAKTALDTAAGGGA